MTVIRAGMNFLGLIGRPIVRHFFSFLNGSSVLRCLRVFDGNDSVALCPTRRLSRNTNDLTLNVSRNGEYEGLACLRNVCRAYRLYEGVLRLRLENAIIYLNYVYRRSLIIANVLVVEWYLCNYLRNGLLNASVVASKVRAAS